MLLDCFPLNDKLNHPVPSHLQEDIWPSPVLTFTVLAAGAAWGVAVASELVVRRWLAGVGMCRVGLVGEGVHHGPRGGPREWQRGQRVLVWGPTGAIIVIQWQVGHVCGRYGGGEWYWWTNVNIHGNKKMSHNNIYQSIFIFSIVCVFKYYPLISIYLNFANIKKPEKWAPKKMIKDRHVMATTPVIAGCYAVAPCRQLVFFLLVIESLNLETQDI